MPSAIAKTKMLGSDVCMRALHARDARFDGVFFVAITTTGIYCRPVCPTRAARAEHRRFFESAAMAERAGYRPCLRCRPELAPGLAVMDAVPRLARVAARRIATGALNGHSVNELARALGVSERHLRRALLRELGVSPLELAQTHRLLLAKRLLADTTLSVTHIAFASGFQSLRRFNTVFRERYRLSPSALRRLPRAAGRPISTRRDGSPADLVRLTLAYRPPLAWRELLEWRAHEAFPGVEFIAEGTYGRAVAIDGHRGVVFVANATSKAQLAVDISPGLVPTLMPLLARLRQFFDLDAEPTVVDAHLEQGGLGPYVVRRPGLRLPGAFHPFEEALRVLFRETIRSGGVDLAARVIRAFGEKIDTGIPALSHLPPSAARLAEEGAAGLLALGVPARSAAAITRLARAFASGEIRLDAGCDATVTRRTLMEKVGIGSRLATTVAMRTLGWPDVFPVTDRSLQRAAGVSTAGALRARAAPWRPWRAYAALHLWMFQDAATLQSPI